MYKILFYDKNFKKLEVFEIRNINNDNKTPKNLIYLLNDYDYFVCCVLCKSSTIYGKKIENTYVINHINSINCIYCKYCTNSKNQKLIQTYNDHINYEPNLIFKLNQKLKTVKNIFKLPDK